MRFSTPTARSLYTLGRLKDAYAVLDEAIGGTAPDASAEAFFFKSYASGHGESVSPYAIEEAVRERLARVEGVVSEATLAAGQLTLAWALYWYGRLAAAVEVGEEAVARARRAGARSIELGALRQVGMAKLHGDVPWSAVEAHAAEMPAADVGRALLRIWAMTMEGRFDEARRTSDAFLADQRERGLQMSIFTHAFPRANLLFWSSVRSTRPSRPCARRGTGFGRLGEHGLRSTIGGWLGTWIARPGGSTRRRRCSTRRSA